MGEHLIVVRLQELGAQDLVLCQQLLDMKDKETLLLNFVGIELHYWTQFHGNWRKECSEGVGGGSVLLAPNPSISPCLESGEGVRGDVERGNLDVFKEVIKLVRVEEDLGQGLVTGTLPQHRSAIQRYLLMLVPSK